MSKPLLLRASSKVSDAQAWLLRGRPDKWLDTRYGRIKSVDRYTATQLLPWWERRLKDAVSRCHGLFVDVGANAGLYTLIAARAGYPVVAIEPSPRAYSCLVETVRANGLARVQALNVAAWDREETLRISQNVDSGYNSIGAVGPEVYGVPLDDILMGRSPAMVKIDTENTEPRVLGGMRATLLAGGPTVIFEAWDRASYSASEAVLASAKYRVTGRVGRLIWVAIPA